MIRNALFPSICLFAVPSVYWFSWVITCFSLTPCRCGSTTCAICTKPLAAHLHPNMPPCKPPPLEADLIALNAKSCPKCGTLAAMRDGCNCVMCSICHTQYCWLCGMDLSQGWVPDGKSKAEVSEHDLLFHSHFMSLEVFADYIELCPLGRIVFRLDRCSGMLSGDFATEQAYEAKNGFMFGIGHPEVARGT